MMCSFSDDKRERGATNRGSHEIVENGKIKNKYGMLRDIQTKTR
jgi:hypothetical protein